MFSLRQQNAHPRFRLTFFVKYFTSSPNSSEVTSDLQSQFYSRLAQEIRARRKSLGKTQEELAEALGLKRTSVVNVEAGRQKLLLHHLFDLSAFLRTDPASLLQGLLPSAQSKVSIPAGLPSETGAAILRGIQRANPTTQSYDPSQINPTDSSADPSRE